MKKQKSNWDEEFDNEKGIYRTLAPIQGIVVPLLYGEAKCLDDVSEGPPSRALILSNMGGTQLNMVPGLNKAHVENMLTNCLRALTHLGVGHGDPKLDNLLLVEDHVVAIDFDSAYMLGNEDPDQEAKFDVSHLSYYYTHIDWNSRE